MSLSVEGQKCPVCQAYLFPEDDLVFCPVCGLAHHRDCYNSIGHCALEHLHGTKEQWQKPEEPTEAETPETEAKTVCRFCGNPLPEDAKFCPNCRAPQGAGQPVHEMPFNIPLDAEIDGIKVEEIAHFTMLNPVRYVRKFSSISKENRLSWNWAAFLFPSAWSFFRKNFKSGILFGMLEIAATLLSLPLNVALQQFVLDSKIPVAQQMITIISENMDKIGYLPVLLMLIGGAVNILIRIIAGTHADYIYRSRAFDEIKAIRGLSEEERGNAYRKKGGINAIFFMLAYYATSFLPTLILNIAIALT